MVKSYGENDLSMDKGISSLDLFSHINIFLPVPDYFSVHGQWATLSLMMCIQNALLHRLGAIETK